MYFFIYTQANHWRMRRTLQANLWPPNRTTQANLWVPIGILILGIFLLMSLR